MGGTTSDRTSYQVWLDMPDRLGRSCSPEQSRLLTLIRDRVAGLVGYPQSHMESLQVCMHSALPGSPFSLSSFEREGQPPH